MHYSKFLFALPLASAAVVGRDAKPQDEVVDYAYTTDVVTVVVTAGAPAATGAPPAANAAAPASSGGHGHAKFHSSAAGYGGAPASSAPPAPPASSSTPAPPANTGASSSSGGSGSGGCPADTSGQHMSPGVNGQPDKSMLDSTNYIRRLYNPSATCLQWSDSLASASQNCANIASESDLRMNSDVVSDPNYGGNYFTGDLASTQFERSMFVMLCQSPSDPQLKGQCPGKVGEVGCSSGPCTGHHDAIVDAQDQNKWVGAAANAGNKWMSCSFSSSSSSSG